MSRRAACLSAVCLFIVTPVPRARAQAAPPVPAVYAEARAERGGDALANVHSLHIVFVVDHVGAGRGPGGGLPSSGSFDRPAEVAQVWLAPPGRFLQTMSMVGGGLGQNRIGVDGDRAIGFARPAAGRRDLMRFALALLMTSPPDLGVTLADLGRTTIDGKPYSGLRASGPDGFDCILLFDAQHRLAMSELRGMLSGGTSRTRGRVDPSTGSTSVQTRETDPFPAQTVLYRQVYSDFKRVDGIELPYTIELDVAGSRTQIWHVSKVELNPKGLDKAFK